MEGRRISMATAAVLAVLALFLRGCTSMDPTGDGFPGGPEDQALPAPQPGDDLWIIGRSTMPTGPGAGRPRSGELRARIDGRDIPLPLKKVDVKARVAAAVSSVDVRQEYGNPYAEKIEAVYVFPLPEDAAVRDFVMTIGSRSIRGIVREREEARRIYLEARRQGYRASLLVEERPNIFSQSVANIEPGRTIDVAIRYFHVLPWRDGAFEFVFPMAITPRYNPQGLRDGIGAASAGAPPGATGQAVEIPYLRPGEAPGHGVSIEVDLAAGSPIAEVASPTHTVDIQRPAGDRALIRLAAGAALPDRDFILRWRPAGEGFVPCLAASRDGAEGYLVLAIAPPRPSGDPVPPREVIAVIDASGSMSGKPIARVKDIVGALLRRLRPADTFQLVKFAGAPSPVLPIPLTATAENVARALVVVAAIEAGGGTEMLDALGAALAVPRDLERSREVLFLTDGAIGNEIEVLAEVRRRSSDTRFHAVGIGEAPNRHLLEEMAVQGRGVAAYVRLDADRKAIEGFLAALEAPALTGLSIEGIGLEVGEVQPDPLPCLHAGRALVLAARCTGGDRGILRIRGTAGARPVEMEMPADLDGATVNPAVGALWARARIAGLARALATSETGREEALIRETALRHGLVSPFTSIVAVDSLERTAGGHGTSVSVPVPVPAGVRYETTVEDR